MEASPWEEGFQGRSISDPLGHVSKMYGVFSNRDLSTSDRQQYPIVWELLMAGAGIFVRWSIALGGSIVSPQGKFSFTVYMYRYKQT